MPRVSTRPLFFLILLTFAALAALPAACQETYVLDHRLPLPGDQGWDYLTLDPATRRLYITRFDGVQVMDLETERMLATLPAWGAHGVALAPGKAYVSNGLSNTVGVFDASSLRSLGQIPVGPMPDEIVYDPSSRRILAFNGRGPSVSVIDAQSDSVVATLALPGKPEAAVADGSGAVFVDIQDRNAVAVLDAAAPALREVWQVPSCQDPTGLALDPRDHLLFAAGQNQNMAVLDTRRGSVVGQLLIGQRPDGAVFDPRTRLVVTSNGEGNFSVVYAGVGRRFHEMDSVPTRPGARTLALDPGNHRLYTVTARFQERKSGRPAILPGSVELLVYRYRPED